MAGIFEQRDERFAGIRGDAAAERIATGCRWAEGPVYVPAMRCLLWSDIPNDRMLRWDETSGAVSVFRQPAGNTNGHTLDRHGRLVSCQHGTRSVTRTEHDGSLTVLADSYAGKRLNSPNDVVVSSDGAVWFTDPAYGIDSDYEGFAASSEIGACYLFRISPQTGTCEAVGRDFGRPNGLAFSLDERRLFVVDSERQHIRVFDVEAGPAGGTPTLRGGAVFADGGSFDGIRLDNAGRVWASAAEGLRCYADDGTLLGLVRLPEHASNLVFGGPKRNRIFITATTSVYSVLTSVTGARPVYAGNSDF